MNSNNEGVTNTAVADVRRGAAPLICLLFTELSRLLGRCPRTRCTTCTPPARRAALHRYDYRNSCSGRARSRATSGEDRRGLLREALTVFCRVVADANVADRRSRSCTATTNEPGGARRTPWCRQRRRPRITRSRRGSDDLTGRCLDGVGADPAATSVSNVGYADHHGRRPGGRSISRVRFVGAFLAAGQPSAFVQCSVTDAPAPGLSGLTRAGPSRYRAELRRTITLSSIAAVSTAPPLPELSWRVFGVSQDGKLIGRFFPSQQFSVGDSGGVTYGPFLAGRRAVDAGSSAAPRTWGRGRVLTSAGGPTELPSTCFGHRTRYGAPTDDVTPGNNTAATTSCTCP